MSKYQVLVVALISFLFGLVVSLIEGFEWWLPITLISMMIIGIIW